MTVCVLPGASGSAVPKSMVVGLVVNEPLRRLARHLDPGTGEHLDQHRVQARVTALCRSRSASVPVRAPRHRGVKRSSARTCRQSCSTVLAQVGRGDLEVRAVGTGDRGRAGRHRAEAARGDGDRAVLVLAELHVAERRAGGRSASSARCARTHRHPVSWPVWLVSPLTRSLAWESKPTSDPSASETMGCADDRRGRRRSSAARAAGPTGESAGSRRVDRHQLVVGVAHEVLGHDLATWCGGPSRCSRQLSTVRPVRSMPSCMLNASVTKARYRPSRDSAGCVAEARCVVVVDRLSFEVTVDHRSRVAT